MSNIVKHITYSLFTSHDDTWISSEVAMLVQSSPRTAWIRINPVFKVDQN